MMRSGLGETMSNLPSFTVNPKKTFLGIDKNRSYCFTLERRLLELYVSHFKLERGNLQEDIILVTEEGSFPATIRLVVQDKSKPRKGDISRPWKNRNVINIGWKNKDQTIKMMSENLVTSIDLVERGLRNSRQNVSFEHLGGNRFYVTFPHIRM